MSHSLGTCRSNDSPFRPCDCSPYSHIGCPSCTFPADCSIQCWTMWKCCVLQWLPSISIHSIHSCGKNWQLFPALFNVVVLVLTQPEFNTLPSFLLIQGQTWIYNKMNSSSFFRCACAMYSFRPRKPRQSDWPFRSFFRSSLSVSHSGSTLQTKKPAIIVSFTSHSVRLFFFSFFCVFLSIEFQDNWFFGRKFPSFDHHLFLLLWLPSTCIFSLYNHLFFSVCLPSFSRSSLWFGLRLAGNAWLRQRPGNKMEERKRAKENEWCDGWWSNVNGMAKRQLGNRSQY